MFNLGKRVGTMVADYTVGLVIVMTHLTIAGTEESNAFPSDDSLDRPDAGRNSQRAHSVRGE